MVEGHQCHRVAAAHRRLMVGKAFRATSPNGRFKEGAAAIDRRVLQRIEVHGKNLFYFYGQKDLTLPASAPAVAHSPATPVRAGSRASRSAPSTQEQPQTSAEPATAAATAAAAAAGGSESGTGGVVRAPPPSTPGQAPPTRAGRKKRNSPASAAPLDPPASRLPEVLGGDAPGGVKPEAGQSHGLGPSSGQEAGLRGEGEGAGGAGTAGDVVVMRVHFGMSGAFRVHALPGPEPTPTTRLELSHSGLGLVAHLSAMTVDWGGLDLYSHWAAKLGPDPLREDADKEVLWQSMQRSRKPVGLVLMSQELVAGIGNIYRAEILFKAGVHPELPSSSCTRAQFEALWFHSVTLLQRGFVSGSILTVDPEEALLLGKPWTRRYIYNQKQCGRCKGAVRSWSMAARTVYCCERCQPLVQGQADGSGAGVAGGEAVEQALALLSPVRRQALAAAAAPRLFTSHCAPDDEDSLALDPHKMTVAQLKARLLALNMATRGNKAQLVASLAAVLPALQRSGPLPTAPSPSPAPSPTTPTPPRKRKAAARTSPAAADALAAEAAATPNPNPDPSSLTSPGPSPGPGPSTVLEVEGESGSEDGLDQAEASLAAALGVPASSLGIGRLQGWKGLDRLAAPGAGLEAGGRAGGLGGQPRARGSAGAETSPQWGNGVGQAQEAGGQEGSQPQVQPGTAWLVQDMVSAKDAALEKAAAGENRAVEHVALADDDTEKLIAVKQRPKRSRKLVAST